MPLQTSLVSTVCWLSFSYDEPMTFWYKIFMFMKWLDASHRLTVNKWVVDQTKPWEWQWPHVADLARRHRGTVPVLWQSHTAGASSRGWCWGQKLLQSLPRWPWCPGRAGEPGWCLNMDKEQELSVTEHRPHSLLSLKKKSKKKIKLSDKQAQSKRAKET